MNAQGENPGTASPATILVVEDNDFVRTQIVTFLKGAGFATLEATDGDRAFEILDGGTVKVTMAVVDVRMEPMDGFEFIGLVRAQGNKMPVMLVTGDQTGDILERANKHGVGAVLLKPVQKERLISTVTRLIERGSR
jgi:CheY-like chemotaxis protein